MPPLVVSVPAHTARRRRILDALQAKDYVGFVAATPQNLFYTCGLWGAGYLVCDDNRAVLLTSRLESARAQSLARDCEVVVGSRIAEIHEQIARLVGTRRFAIDDVPASLLQAIREKAPTLALESDMFLGVRRSKDPEEQVAISEAARALDKLFEEVPSILRPGVSERLVGTELVRRAMELGCEPPNSHDGLSPVIVASGAHAAYPHWDLSNRLVADGELVLVDLFVRWEGYFADATRVFAVGAVAREARTAYDAVQVAHAAGLEALRVGATGGQVDQAVRGCLEARGLGDAFVHSTGHGVGLDIHEAPWLRKGSEDVLATGDVVTVEPGVYVPGRLGIRIEDTMLVDHQPATLTRFTRELVTIA